MTIFRFCTMIGVVCLLCLATETVFAQNISSFFQRKKAVREKVTLEKQPHLIPDDNDRDAAIKARESLLDPEYDHVQRSTPFVQASPKFDEIDPNSPQMTVEVRIISCPPDLIAPNGFDLKNGWVFVPNRQEQKNPSKRITDQLVEDNSNAAGVVSITETYTPIAFRFLDKVQIQKFLSGLQSDNHSNVLQAPKVTVFHGQSATVCDTTMRYFVTSVNEIQDSEGQVAIQPGIEIVDEGFFVNLQCELLDDDSIVLKRCNIICRDVEDIAMCTLTHDEVKSSDTKNTNSGVTVQSPKVKTTSVSLPVTIPHGKVLLVAEPSQKKTQNHEETVMCFMISCTAIKDVQQVSGQKKEYAIYASSNLNDTEKEWEELWLLDTPN